MTLLSWLVPTIQYCLKLLGKLWESVSWFLIHERQGHCEYFAGAMVALLNDIGIPARMVAGFSGGSLSFNGEEAVIRQANAHTWVEAWVGETDTRLWRMLFRQVDAAYAEADFSQVCCVGAEKMGRLIKQADPYDHLTSVHGHHDFRFHTSS